MRELVDASGGLPDPGRAGSLDEFVGHLRQLKIWAGDPSYEIIKDRVNAAWTEAGRPAATLAGKSTVADCFRSGRRRMNAELVLSVVEALCSDAEYVSRWRSALRAIGDRVGAARQVQVREGLPPDLPVFAGRADELVRIEDAARRGQTVVAISGMAGVGKTSLAVRAGRLLAGKQGFDRTFFVNLRGFHPDPAQPPVDPAAVLEAFLALLGVPAERIPRDLKGRVVAFRERLSGLRVLSVLDNAADEEQMRLLVAPGPGCLTLVTSRRSLGGQGVTPVAVEVFSAKQAVEFLGAAAASIPTGTGADALDRIARRCGYLPLALGLVARYIAGSPGWTLTDHADRLDSRLAGLRLDGAVELALDVSYRHLPTAERRLVRLLALHPGQDFDPYAAAALSGTDLTVARGHLQRLVLDHLLQNPAEDRYAFHDLVRAHATARADDEPPSAQRAALTRLFDFYLATTATAMDTLYPAEAAARPEVERGGPPAPDLADPVDARSWLLTERFSFVAVIAHAATHGWHLHAMQLSSALFRYLRGGHNADALVIHGWACDAAGQVNDPVRYAHALTDFGTALGQAGRIREAAQHFERALRSFDEWRDSTGQVRALGNLGLAEGALGHYHSAVGYLERALVLSRQMGNQVGEELALEHLARYEVRLGRYRAAYERLQEPLESHIRDGKQFNEAQIRLILGDADLRRGRFVSAADHLETALRLFQGLASRTNEGWARYELGLLHTQLGEHAAGSELYQEALEIFLDTGARNGEADARNGLGDATRASGRPADAIVHHTTALRVAIGSDYPYGQATAHGGLGSAHQALGESGLATRHFREALRMFRTLEVPEGDDIQRLLDGGKFDIGDT